MSDRMTDRHVAKLEAPKKGAKIHFDDPHKGVGGFGVRITAKGVRTFVLCYRGPGGVQRKLKIGRFPAWRTEGARIQAKKFKQQIDRGVDPVQELEDADRAAQLERAEPTIAVLADLYINGRPDPERPGEFLIEPRLPDLRPDSRDAYKRYLEKHIVPRFGAIRVKDVTHRDAERLHRGLGRHHKHAANRALAVLGALLSFAVKHNFIASNPLHGKGKSIERFEEARRERFLSQSEIARVLEVLNTWPDWEAACAIRLLLLTGARRGELQKLRWADLQAGQWVKPSAHTKSRKMQRLTLSAPAQAVLNELRSKSADAEWVFPSPTRRGQPRGDLSKVWKKVARAAGIEDARLHDLRHTHASLLVSAGVSLPMIAGLLGHVTVSTTARYSHLYPDPLRDAVERVGSLVQAAETGHVADIKLLHPSHSRVSKK